MNKVRWLCINLGCEPTYEELKQQYMERLKAEPMSCEPTYEELKLSIATPLSLGFLCCEPTYEELKP